MRILSIAVFVFVLALLGWLAWRWLPGLRPHVAGAYEKYGGWTEEARRDDPVGFLEHARQELGKDAQAFAESRVELASAAARAREELARTRELRASADALAEELRAAFRAAEAADAWPARVAGADYERDELVRQVEVVLRTRATSDEAIGDLEAVLEQAAASELDLIAQIEATRAALAAIDAKIALARIDEQAASTRELLERVASTLGANAEVRDVGDTPVRTVEELLAVRAAGVDATEREVDALGFLVEDE